MPSIFEMLFNKGGQNGEEKKKPKHDPFAAIKAAQEAAALKARQEDEQRRREQEAEDERRRQESWGSWGS